ncbi:hypothetical protein SAMN05444279_1148 [Ruegeria intermedia]|uniref:Uracil DNA glycosylase superfamily protein n=1 Tax=Ruegeria intermedia TaxID=996115 RepID=A0A1M4Y5A6_9RHOB|nr:hypothetical protein [Ruegeria intermedia]SHF00885.1 hypothetical protein SAMN05444279_1148 [Ruegeria intermedia]
MAQELSIASEYFHQLSETKADQLLDRSELSLARDGNIDVVYAPFDHVERKACLVVVGITPGMTQAVNAINAAVRARCAGKTLQASLADAKLTASFSGGAIRNNLVSMLDAIGVATHFGLQSTSEMFRPGSTDVHFTSALRYPVFVSGKNYNGAPNMLKTPILRSMIETHLAEEAALLPNAIWLPLGPKAEMAIRHLSDKGLISESRILAGLPHPSGANAERVAVFLGRKKPEDASAKTNPVSLLAASVQLKKQIASLKGAAA